MPVQINPAEWLLDLVNVDFARGNAAAEERLDTISAAWGRSPSSLVMISAANTDSNQEYKELRVNGRSGTTQLLIPVTLLHRNFIKSYRDVVAYGIRFAMYIGSNPFVILHGSLLMWRRSCDHDGDCVVETGHHSGAYTAFRQRNCMSHVSDILRGKQLSDLRRSSLAQRSCPSWPLPMFLLSSKIAPPSPKKTPMASTGLQASSLLTS